MFISENYCPQSSPKIDRSRIDNPLMMMRDHNKNNNFGDSEVFTYTKDHLGSIRELTNKDQKLVQRYDYSAYGFTTLEKTENQNTNIDYIENFYAHTGCMWLPQTGDCQHRARWRNQDRWLSEDPEGLSSGSDNYYIYGVNPIYFKDSNGLILEGYEEEVAWAADFSAGLGSSLSFGITDAINDATGAGGSVNKCSGAYNGGQWAGLGLSLGRLAYAGAAKVGASLASSAQNAVQFRNTLKVVFRGGFFPNVGKKTYAQLVREHGGDLAKVQAAAGRTNRGVNTAGALGALSSSLSLSGNCGCQ